MKNSLLNQVCRNHLKKFHAENGSGALARLARKLDADVCTLRNIANGSNTNATASNLEKILRCFDDPVYSLLLQQVQQIQRVSSKVEVLDSSSQKQDAA